MSNEDHRRVTFVLLNTVQKFFENRSISHFLVSLLLFVIGFCFVAIFYGDGSEKLLPSLFTNLGHNLIAAGIGFFFLEALFGQYLSTVAIKAEMDRVIDELTKVPEGDISMVLKKIRDKGFLEKNIFQGRNLRQINLSNQDLQGVNLRDTQLNDANLRGAKLDGADLHGATLFDADLTQASLTKADLRGARMQGAHLEGADFTKAKMLGANLAQARCDNTTVLPDGTCWTQLGDLKKFAEAE